MRPALVARVCGRLWSDRRDVVALTALALLCWALQSSGGTWDPFALSLLVVSVAVLAVAWFLPPTAGDGRLVVGLTAPVLVFEAYQTFWEDGSRAYGVTFLAVPLLVLLLVAVRAGRARLMAAAGAAGLVVALLVWNLVPIWGKFGIDVLTIQQQAGSDILAGHDPYRSVDMLYFPVGATGSILVAGHFAYGPTVAFADAAVRWLGDVRLADLLGFLILGGSVVALAARRGRRSAYVAFVLVAAFPLTVYMARHGWVDTLTLAAFAAWLALRHHDRRVLGAIALGLGICAKPTVAILVIPYLVWSPRCRREVLAAVAVCLAILAPFAVSIGPHALWDDIVGVELRLPVRYDSLGINAWLLHGGNQPLPLVISSLAVLAVIALIVVRRPRGESDLLLGAALLTFVIYLVAKWAFYDYYFDVAVLIVMAVAARGLALAGNEEPALPMRALARLRRRAVTRPLTA